MPKKKSPQLSIEDYLRAYDGKSLVAAAATVQNSFAWSLLQAYLKLKQREFEVAALDLLCHDGSSLMAAKASGQACAYEELAVKLIPELIERLKGGTGVVENLRPED